MFSKNKKKIYYWASNEIANNGEGILAINFKKLLKNNFKNYLLIPINKYNHLNQETFFYKYFIPFWGVLKLWSYYFQKQKVCYINFLPAWNIFLILFLPPKTIIGPVSGSINRKNFNKIIKFFSIIGIRILSIKNKKIIFTHDFFRKFLRNNKDKYFFNFLLYNFKMRNSKAKKKYDFIFYIRDHSNKRNVFIIKLIKKLRKRYKICIIGKTINLNKNVFNKGFVSKNKVLTLIAQSRFAISGYENLYSYFLLDCLSNRLLIFYNKDFKIYKSTIDTSLLKPMSFIDIKSAENTIFKNINKKTSKKVYVNINNFNSFF